MPWISTVLPHLESIKADFEERYRVDLDELPAKKSWHWFVSRLRQLLMVPPAIIVAGKETITLHQTRVGFAMYPPKT